MKKDKIKIGNVEIEYTDSEVLKLFRYYYDQECNADRINKLKDELCQFHNIDEKIEYCKNVQSEYVLYLKAEIIEISGMTIARRLMPKDAKLFFDEKIQIIIDSLEAEKLTKKRKKPVVTAPAVALFAQIVNFSKVLEIDENETDESYSIRVINHFKIPDVSIEKCRQAFKKYEPDLKQSDRNFKIVMNSILPKLNNTDKDRIQKYIDNKIKLYG